MYTDSVIIHSIKKKNHSKNLTKASMWLTAPIRLTRGNECSEEFTSSWLRPTNRYFLNPHSPTPPSHWQSSKQLILAVTSWGQMRSTVYRFLIYLDNLGFRSQTFKSWEECWSHLHANRGIQTVYIVPWHLHLQCARPSIALQGTNSLHQATRCTDKPGRGGAQPSIPELFSTLGRRV